ncbi:MAG: hemolysin III family protein [Actinomycetota bacterium]|nr:hemolysin III family protein [Actinomycetota bacterium]
MLHRWAAVASVMLFIGLSVAANDMGSRLVVALYGCCVTAMLGVSAVYHSGRLSPTAVRVLKRLDHATILLAIAGTYTAVIALALEDTTRAVLLVMVWAAALIGIAIRMLWLDAPYPLVAVVYLVVGWIGLVDIEAFLRALSDGQMALVVLGGLLYTAGAIVYAARRPDPVPAVFGYHEVFHALVVGGAVAHYLAVLAIVGAS